MSRQIWGKAALALTLAASLAGCQSLGDFAPSSAKSVHNGSAVPPRDDAPAADRMKVAPLGPNDLDCPYIDIADGGASMRVGGADNKSVSYQFDIHNVARECLPQGDTFALKIGVTGLLLIGPAGRPGAYSTDLKIVVANVGDKKTVFEKTYRIAADTQGGAEASFELLADPIVLPLTRTDLDMLFNVTIGFGRSVDAPAPRGRKRPPG